jgi:NAD-dependent deacetylase
VVLFGDTLPAEAWQAAGRSASRCDLFLIIETSGLVYPAAHLPDLARKAGARLMEMGLHPSSYTPKWISTSREGQARSWTSWIASSVDPRSGRMENGGENGLDIGKAFV